jgi:hypothetical protein
MWKHIGLSSCNFCQPFFSPFSMTSAPFVFAHIAHLTNRRVRQSIVYFTADGLYLVKQLMIHSDSSLLKNSF